MVGDEAYWARSRLQQESNDVRPTMVDTVLGEQGAEDLEIMASLGRPFQLHYPPTELLPIP
jgi:hypothetical protein